MEANLMVKYLEQTLDKQKQLAATAIQRQGQRPTIRASRPQLEYWFSPSGRPSVIKTNEVHVKQTVVGYAYPPCTTPLEKLEVIELSELRLETHHRGQVVIGRALGTANRIQAVQNGIEDCSGNVDRVAAYNLDPDATPQALLPKGAVFAIKEPFYKLAGDGFPSVRIDHPSDIVRLDPSHPLVPGKFKSAAATAAPKSTASDLKAAGNTSFKQKQWSEAVLQYSEAIDKCSPEDDALRHDLLRNRAMAYLNIGRYEQALTDAKAAVIPNSEAHKLNSKAHYRAGYASYELGDFEEARNHFEQARKLSPEDLDTERGYKRTISRLLEQRAGKYDLTDISKSVSDKHRYLDHASFTEKVEVRVAPGRGRGLFAKKAIKASDLVLVEKGLCVAFSDDDKSSISMIMNLNTNSMSTGPHAALHVQIIQDAIRNPAKARALLDLYDDGYKPKSGKIVDGVFVIDVFQAHQIVEANVFGCSATTTTEDHLFGRKKHSVKDEIASSCGVWMLASRMNHACNGNASRAFVGDLMVVHALRDIGEGEELFVSYKHHDGNHEEMKEGLSKKWGFQCCCSICSAEEETKQQLPARLSLLKEADAFFYKNVKWLQDSSGMPAALLTKAEDIYSRLEKTYPPEVFEHIPRLGLCRIGLWIARIYLNQNKHVKAAAKALTALRDFGYFVTISADSVKVDRRHCHAASEVVNAFVYVANSYLYRGKQGIANQLKDLAGETYRVLYGTMNHVEEMYGEL